MPKKKLDQMGQYWDIGFRVRDVQQYLSDKVQQAQRVIYEPGHVVAGTSIDGILKSTSIAPAQKI